VWKTCRQVCLFLWAKHFTEFLYQPNAVSIKKKFCFGKFESLNNRQTYTVKQNMVREEISKIVKRSLWRFDWNCIKYRSMKFMIGGVKPSCSFTPACGFLPHHTQDVLLNTMITKARLCKADDFVKHTPPARRLSALWPLYFSQCRLGVCKYLPADGTLSAVQYWTGAVWSCTSPWKRVVTNEKIFEASKRTSAYVLQKYISL